MRAFHFIIGATLLTLVVSSPASAQVYLDVGPHGIDVGVGTPDYGWRDRHYGYRDDYASDCRVIRERIVTPFGQVIYRSHQICD